jgi:EmrB/QacA subfamily drug resistance transporter
MAEAGAQTVEPTFCPQSRRIYVLVAAILASSMAFIDGSVLSIAIPSLRADLGATLADAQWVSNGYLLFLGSLLLLGGAAGDRFGLRLVFGLGIGVFVAASMVCALAPQVGVLIVARAVQGIGAALMIPGSLAIIAKAYPKAERGRAIGTWAAASSLTTIMGPVLGGFVLTALGDWSWRLVFAINLPLGGIALALLILRVPVDGARARRKLDIVGAVLASLGLMLLAFGLTGSGSESVPPLSHIVIYCCAGLLSLAWFVWWELWTEHPMLPLRLFTIRQFSGANALTFILYFALTGTTFYLPMTLIGGWGASPAEVSMVMLPFGVAIALLSGLSGRWADRFGAGPPITVGAVWVGLAFAGLAVTAPLQQIWQAVLPLMCMAGVGMALVVSPLSTAVMTAVDDDDTGIASGTNNAVSRVAGLVAVAAMGMLATLVFERALGGAAELPVYFGLAADGLSPQEEAMRQLATNAAFSTIAYFNAGLCLASAVVAWLTLERKG